MSIIRRLAVAAGVLALVLAPGAAAQAAPNAQDNQFLRAAHQSNLAEIAAGELAQQKAQAEQVKDLGARFVADHTRLDAALRQVAEALQVELPELPNAEQRALQQRYEAASGEQFDALWVATQMDAHMKSMRLGEKELADGSDARVRELAQDAAPVIRAHHEGLDAAASDLGLPSGVNTGSGGAAAPRSLGTIAVPLLVLGLLLVVGAVAYLRRARTSVS